MLQDAEQRIGFRFPPDISNFYRLCNGLEVPTSNWMWNFPPIECVTTLFEYCCHSHGQLALYGSNAEVLTHSLVVFCDVLIDAPIYAYCADDRSEWFGHFFADQGGTGWHVADSFFDFVNVFVDESEEVLLNCR